MLPDIIDKPLGLVVFGTPAIGRTIAHTFLFLLFIVLLAIRFQDSRIASISGVSWLISFWIYVEIARYPILAAIGNFQVTTGTSTFGYLQQLLFERRDPVMLVPEVLGLSYLIYLAFEHRSTVVVRLGRVVEGHENLKDIVLMLFH